jgi:RNA polymerase sigma factor (sigma-70 family)
MDDHALLREFVVAGSEPAFRRLVERHVNLVYSTARRRLRDLPGADDVTQQVFTLLARKAARLGRSVVLSGWLYRATCHLASETSRRETRRQQRDQLAAELMKPDETESAWRTIEPLLDEAMEQLGETDRDAVVLRYFDKKSLREVGRALGVSDDAAQKRLSRALEKLRGFFARNRHPLTDSAVVTAIAAGAVQAAPAGLAASISSAAFAGTAVTTSILTTVMSWISLKPIATTTVAIAAGTALVVQTKQLSDTRQTNASLLHRTESAERSVAEAQANLAHLIRASEDDPRVLEIARLRAELATLRREQAGVSNENVRLQAALDQAGHALPETETDDADLEKDALKQIAIAKMNYTKQWGLA